MASIKLAQDLAATWERARSEQRKQLLAALFETVRIGGGQIVSVPRPEVAPLVAVTLTEPKTGGPDRIRTGDLVLDRDVC